jgi:predicted outer membrane lipoprotein
MKRVVIRGVGAALVSAVISILGFLLVGAFLPMWTMILLYGRQDVEDSPAHGGAILLMTMPFAGVLSVCAFCILTAVIYRRLSRRSRR